MSPQSPLFIVFVCISANMHVRWLKGLELGSLLRMHFLTLFTLWDVAQLPSFVFVSGVTPDSVVEVVARISTEVVVAHVRVIAFVRGVF